MGLVPIGCLGENLKSHWWFKSVAFSQLCYLGLLDLVWLE